MAYTIPTQQPPQYNGDDEGFVGSILEGIRSIPHLPNAVLKGTNEEGISPEEKHLRQRALSEAALWVIPALVTPAAGAMLKTAPTIIRAVLSGAAGLSAGMGLSAAAKGEDVAPAATEGALWGAGFGALGGLAERGAKLAAEEVATHSAVQAMSGEATKLAAERQVADLAGTVRVKYRDALGAGMTHDQIMESFAPVEQAVASRETVPLKQRPFPVSDIKWTKDAKQQFTWAEDNWPKAEAAGLTKADYVGAASKRGIPPEVTLSALRVPESEWALHAAGDLNEHKALNTVLETQGQDASLSTLAATAPARKLSPSLVQRVRAASVPAAGIEAPEVSVRAAGKAADDIFTPFKNIKAAVEASSAPKVFDQASMLLYRALAPARATLGKLGPAGVELADKIDNIFLNFRQIGGQDVAQVRQILAPFKKEDRIHIGEIMEGLTIPKSPAHEAAADQLAGIYSKYSDEIGQLGFRQLLGDHIVRKFKGRDLYLTHYFDDKTIEKYLTPGTPEFEKTMAFMKEKAPEFAGTQKQAIATVRKWLKTPPEFRTGPINYSRSQLLQDAPYEKDPLKAMSRYIFNVRKRLEIAKVFGVSDKGVLPYYQQMEAEGKPWKVAQHIYNAFAGLPESDYQELTRATNTFNTLTMLGVTSGVVQPAQLLNVASKTSYAATLKALAQIHNKVSREWALSTGAYLDEAVQDMIGTESDIGKFWVSKVIGLEPLDKANRVVAALAGKIYATEQAAKYAAKPTLRLAERLKKLGLDPEMIAAQGGKLTPDQARRAGLVTSLDTQFGSQVLDLPDFKNTDGGKFVYQFKSFALQQTSFIQRELMKPAMSYLTSGGRRGDLGPLLRYAAGIGPTGAIIGSLIRTIKGRPEPDDPRLKLIENAALAGGFGIFYDTWSALAKSPNDFLAFFAGPTAGNIAQLATGTAKAVQGKPDALAESAVRRIPLIGQTLANYWLYPPTK